MFLQYAVRKADELDMMADLQAGRTATYSEEEEIQWEEEQLVHL